MRSMAALCLIMLYAFNQKPSPVYNMENRPVDFFSADTNVLRTIALPENNTVAFSNSNILNGQTQTDFPVIYTNLMVSYEDGLTLTDGVAAGFDNNFSAAVDGDDAAKLWNFNENIALVRGNNTLSIEFRPIPKLTDTLFYRLYLKQNELYTLKIYSKDLAKLMGIKAWLNDKYLDTITEVNLQDTTLYNFAPNTDTNSYRNRFMLMFDRQFTATAVPFTKEINQTEPAITGFANRIAATSAGISLYPNPIAGGGRIMIKFNDIQKGNYDIAVYSSKGQKLAGNKIIHTGGNNIYPVKINPSWMPGVYTITIENTALINSKESNKARTRLSFLITKN